MGEKGMKKRNQFFTACMAVLCGIVMTVSAAPVFGQTVSTQSTDPVDYEPVSYGGSTYAIVLSSRNADGRLTSSLNFSHVLDLKDNTTAKPLSQNVNTVVFEIVKNSQGQYVVNDEASADVYAALNLSVIYQVANQTYFTASDGGTDANNGLPVLHLAATSQVAVSWTSILAQVTYTLDGSSHAVTLKGELGVEERQASTTERPADDTTDKLNTYLVSLGDTIAADTTEFYTSGNNTLTIDLAAGTYEGTIVIPQTVVGYVALAGKSGSAGTTTIHGGIDIQGCIFGLSNLIFTAPAADNTAALGKVGVWCSGAYVGGNIWNSQFSGYDYAVYADPGYILPSRMNTFQNNGVAIYINPSMSAKSHTYFANLVRTRFQNNGTALQIAVLPGDKDHYGFRMNTCDFIDNTQDIVGPSTGGKFYFYRNFFGSADTSGTVTSRTPVCSGSTVVVYPVFAAPVSKTGTGTLTVPLSVAEIAVQQADAGKLDISLSSLQTRTSPLTIRLESNGVLKGSWQIPTQVVTTAALTPQGETDSAFNPGVTITASGSVTTVTPAASDTALQALKPILTIPYSGTTPTVQNSAGTTIRATLSDGSLSFPVESGGAYTVVMGIGIGAVQVNGTAVSVITAGFPTDAVVLVAGYDTNGHLAGIARGTRTEETSGLFSATLPTAAASVKVFAMDENCTPLTTQWTSSKQ